MGVFHQVQCQAGAAAPLATVVLLVTAAQLARASAVAAVVLHAEDKMVAR